MSESETMEQFAARFAPEYNEQNGTDVTANEVLASLVRDELRRSEDMEWQRYNGRDNIWYLAWKNGT